MKNFQNLYLIAVILTLSGAIAQLFEMAIAPYVFSLGALSIALFQLKNYIDNKTATSRVSRLARIGFISSLLLVLAGYLMFTNNNGWVVALLVYALSTLVLSFRGNN